MTGRIVTAAGARIGDALLLTKGIAIEAFHSCPFANQPDHPQAWSEIYRSVSGYLIRPDLSVLKEAQVVVCARGVHAMHDPTEGGLSAAL